MGEGFPPLKPESSLESMVPCYRCRCRVNAARTVLVPAGQTTRNTSREAPW